MTKVNTLSSMLKPAASPQSCLATWRCFPSTYIDIAFSIGQPATDHCKLSILCCDHGLHGNAPPLSASFLPSGSDKELNLVLFVLNNLTRWSIGSVEQCASGLISLFQEAWDYFAKVGPAEGHFNKCTHAKLVFNNHPTHHHYIAFHATCKAAKKAYFANKLINMIKQCKPWVGTQWIKDCPIPKVPQIRSTAGNTINKLQLMFEAFQQQFQPALDGQSWLYHPFLETLPSKPTRPFVPFSPAELHNVLSTCSSASAPSPSHMTWALLKLFLADLAFQEQFLGLANDIVNSGVWPSVFKTSFLPYCSARMHRQTCQQVNCRMTPIRCCPF